MARQVEVKASWMQACGRGTEARVYEVLRTWKANGFTFVEVLHDGQPWTVLLDWRGQWIDTKEV